MLSLQLYDTAKRNIGVVSTSGGAVKMYVCGMTPKDKPHIGHARLFVHADVLRRYLEFRGLQVIHVQNFTDVDDKIIERAKAAGLDPISLAQTNTAAYFDVMDRLNVTRAHLFPKVTDNIGAIVAAIQELLDKGFAYLTSNGVYFEVGRWLEYGRLSGRTQEDVLAGARIDVDEEKRDPRDFALWKRHKEGEIYWESPWGRGRPGWHIECSSMIRAHLGPQIDIHVGGSDLVFPHHENELAQAEAGFGVKPFVGTWFHVGVLRIQGEKMGHSLGNFVTVEEAFKQVHPLAVRFFLLSTHYRSPVDFGRDSLQQAAAGYERLSGALRAEPESAESLKPEPSAALLAASQEATRAFTAAMDADLNTSAALGALFDLARAINRYGPSVAEADLTEAKATLTRLAGVLGLDLEAKPAHDGRIEPLVELLIAVRAELRTRKLWDVSDRIRAELAKLGVTLEDGASGTTWRLD